MKEKEKLESTFQEYFYPFEEKPWRSGRFFVIQLTHLYPYKVRIAFAWYDKEKNTWLDQDKNKIEHFIFKDGANNCGSEIEFSYYGDESDLAEVLDSILKGKA